MTNEELERDPELVEDEKDDLEDDVDVVLPVYNGAAFEVDKDFEYVIEGDEEEDGI